MNEKKISETIPHHSGKNYFVTYNKHSNHCERPYVVNFYCPLSTTRYHSTLFEDTAYRLGKNIIIIQNFW